VVHQVGHARDRSGRERQRLDQRRIRLGRRRHGRSIRIVDVVGEPDLDPAARRVREGAADDPGERVRQADVVDRDLERFLRRRDETGERMRDLLRRLAAVGERRDLYRAAFARCSALWARLAAW
jgi:hypothetical protein